MKSLLVTLISGTSSDKKFPVEIINFLFSKNILKLLVDCLKKLSTKELDKKLDSRFKQEFLYQMIKEEELLLQCIFIILNEYSDKVGKNDDIKLELLTYFVNNGFEGYFFSLGSEISVSSEYANLIRDKSCYVNDLSTFCSLLWLSTTPRSHPSNPHYKYY